MNTRHLTDALIVEVATNRGAWTREQLGILGVPWPPPKGWRERLVAEKRTLTDDEVEELREARVTVAERRGGYPRVDDVERLVVGPTDPGGSARDQGKWWTTGSLDVDDLTLLVYLEGSLTTDPGIDD